MAKAQATSASLVGVDVSEARLDVHVWPSGGQVGFDRDPRGLERLVAWLASKERPPVVMEATGGLERGLEATLDQVGIAVAVVNPRRARDFARAAGLLAKPVLGPADGRTRGTDPDRCLRPGAVRRAPAARGAAGARARRSGIGGCAGVSWRN